jgi:hypothetical protein
MLHSARVIPEVTPWRTPVIRTIPPRTELPRNHRLHRKQGTGSVGQGDSLQTGGCGVFNIELLGQPEGEGERLFNWGRITLGDFIDEFQAPLFDWAPGDYAAHWLESAQRLLRGAPVAVFLTHMVHPTAPYHLGWPAWRRDDRVYVQERLFLRDQLDGDFDPEFPEVHAGPHQETSAEGVKIAQWVVSVRELQDFVERRRRSNGSA